MRGGGTTGGRGFGATFAGGGGGSGGADETTWGAAGKVTAGLAADGRGDATGLAAPASGKNPSPNEVSRSETNSFRAAGAGSATGASTTGPGLVWIGASATTGISWTTGRTGT